MSGNGSIWNNSGPVNVGYSGNGSLNISDGGQVDTAVLLVGSQPGSSGAITIQSGGQLTNTGSAFVGGLAGSTASVLVDAASWTNTGCLYIGTGGGPGAVTVMDSGKLMSACTVVGGQGSLTADPSTVDVNGDFTLDPGGVLSLDIAGTAPGSFSDLDITGSGFFDGTIDFDFIDGFAPLAGETFDLINATGGADLSTATFEIEGLEPGFDYSIVNGVLTASNDGVSDTPEPNSAWLLAGALSCVLLAARREAFVGRRLSGL